MATNAAFPRHKVFTLVIEMVLQLLGGAETLLLLALVKFRSVSTYSRFYDVDG